MSVNWDKIRERAGKTSSSSPNVDWDAIQQKAGRGVPEPTPVQKEQGFLSKIGSALKDRMTGNNDLLPFEPAPMPSGDIAPTPDYQLPQAEAPVRQGYIPPTITPPSFTPPTSPTVEVDRTFQGDIAPGASSDFMERLPQTNYKTPQDTLIDAWKRGNLQSDLGQAYYYLSQEPDNPNYQAKVKQLEEAIAQVKPAGEDKTWLQKGLTGAVEMLPMQGKSVLAGVKTGVATLPAALAAGALGGGISGLPVVGAGFSVGTANYMAKLEAGHAYREAIQQGVDHKTAKATSMVTGAINAALEVIQLGELGKAVVKAIPGGKSLLKEAAEEATESIGKILLKEYPKFILSQSSEEALQQLVTSAGVEIGKSITNKVQGTNLPVDAKQPLIDAAHEFIQTIPTFAVSGLLPHMGQAYNAAQPKVIKDGRVLTPDEVTGPTPQLNPATGFTMQDAPIDVPAVIYADGNPAEMLLKPAETGTYTYESVKPRTHWTQKKPVAQEQVAATLQPTPQPQIATQEPISTPGDTSTPKNPWQMTRDEFYSQYPTIAGRRLGMIHRQHEQAIKQAIRVGQDVPGNVLSNYPNLMAEIAAEDANSQRADDAYAETQRRNQDIIDRQKATETAKEQEKLDARESAKERRWQIPKAQYVTYKRGEGKALQEYEHRQSVEQALRDGKPVPAEVLSDYQDLRSQSLQPQNTAQGSLSASTNTSASEQQTPFTDVPAPSQTQRSLPQDAPKSQTGVTTPAVKNEGLKTDATATASKKPNPIAPPKLGSVADIPTRIKAFNAKAKTLDVTADEVKQHADFIVQNRDAIIAHLYDLVNKHPQHAKKRKATKQDIAEASYRRLLQDLYYATVGDSIVTPMSFDGTSMDDQRQKVIIQGINKLTDEAIAKRREEKDKVSEAVKNPQTLSDFREASLHRDLTADEKRKMEDLEAQSAKEREQKQKVEKQEAKREATTLGDYEIVEDVDTRDNSKLWVAKLKERLSEDAFKALRAEWKPLGISWSPYKKGFISEFDPTEKISAWMGGQKPVEKSNPIAPPSLEKKSAPQKLRELADGMQSKIDEIRNADRKTNTAKRAREATGKLAEADSLEQDQKTLRRIADAIEDGRAKLLVDLSTKTQLDALDAALHRAKNNYERQNNISYSESLKRSVGLEDIEAAEMPFRIANGEQLKWMIEKGKTIPGMKMIANRLAKLTPSKNGTVNIESHMDDFIKLAKATDYWHNYQDQYADRQRLIRLGITDTAKLRAYLREYLDLRAEKRERTKADEIKDAERELIGVKIPGYFPTPKPIVNRMLQEADIQDGDKVLEPSAGRGHIADAIGVGKVDVVEISGSNRKILELKGHTLVGNDALQVEGQYDKIVMNPPFENGQDIDHVRYAYDHNLKPGGRLVAIMGEGAYFRSYKKDTAFREWLSEVGRSEKLPEGTFNESDVPTGTNTRLVVIEKPQEKKAIEKQSTGAITLYHGSPRAGLSNLTEGTWFSPVKEFAQRFAEGKSKSKRDKATVYEATVDINALRLLDVSEVGMEAYVTIKQLSKITGIELSEMQDAFKSDPVLSTFSADKPNALRYIVDQQAFIDLARSKGYDGLRAKEGLTSPTDYVPTYKLFNATALEQKPNLIAPPPLDITESKEQSIISQLDAMHDPKAKYALQAGNIRLSRYSPDVSRLLMELGTATTGVRLQDAEGTGTMRYMLAKGDVTHEQWDKYVQELRYSGKIQGEEAVKRPDEPKRMEPIQEPVKSEPKSIDRRTAHPADLAAHYKAMGMNRNRAWDQFVIDRAMKPDMSAKDFMAVFDSQPAIRLKGYDVLLDQREERKSIAPPTLAAAETSATKQGIKEPTFPDYSAAVKATKTNPNTAKGKLQNDLTAVEQGNVKASDLLPHLQQAKSKVVSGFNQEQRLQITNELVNGLETSDGRRGIYVKVVDDGELEINPTAKAVAHVLDGLNVKDTREIETQDEKPFKTTPKATEIAPPPLGPDRYPVGTQLLDYQGKTMTIEGRRPSGEYMVKIEGISATYFESEADLDRLSKAQDSIQKQLAADKERQAKAESEAQSKSERESIGDFYADKGAMAQGRAKQLLNKSVRYELEGKTLVTTKKEYVANLLEAGYRPEAKQYVDQKAKETAEEHYRQVRAWNANPNHPDHIAAKKAVDNPPVVTDYRLYAPDGTFHTITKTEYEYAQHLQGKKQDTVAKVESEIKTLETAMPTMNLQLFAVANKRLAKFKELLAELKAKGVTPALQAQVEKLIGNEGTISQLKRQLEAQKRKIAEVRQKSRQKQAKMVAEVKEKAKVEKERAVKTEMYRNLDRLVDERQANAERIEKIKAKAQAKLETTGKRYEERIANLKTTHKIKMAVAKERWQQHLRLQKKQQMLRKILKQSRQNLVKLLKKLRSEKRTMRPEFQAQAEAILDQYDTYAMNMTSKTRMKLEGIVEFMEQQKQLDPSYEPPADLLAKIARLEKKRVGEMEMDDILAVQQLVSHVLNMNETVNRMIGEAQVKEVKDAAQEGVLEMNPPDTDQERQMGRVERFLAVNALNPRVFAKRMANSKVGTIVKYFYTRLSEGAVKKRQLDRDAHEYIAQKLEPFRKQIQGWGNTDKRETFQLATGKVELTKMELISLYMASLNRDNRLHLTENGGTVKGSQKVMKFTDADFAAIRRIVHGNEAMKVIAETYEYIFDQLLKTAINETSLVIDGYHKAQVEHYWPILINRDFQDTDKGSLKRFWRATLEGAGYLKEREGGAQVIRIENAEQAVERAIEMVSSYYGYAVPIRNAKAILGQQEFKRALDRKFGYPAENYWETLFGQLEGGRLPLGALDSDAKWLASKVTQSIMGMNASIIMQQFSSLPKAYSAGISVPKLMAGILKSADWKTIERHSGEIWKRRQGYVYREAGDIAEVKSQRVLGMGWTLKGIEWADSFVVGTIWNAVEAEMRETTNLQGDALYEAVARKTEEVINTTQQSSELIHRSGTSRDESAFSRLMLAFTSEANATYNMLYEAAMDLKADPKANKAKFTRTVAGFVASAMLSASLRMLMTKLRKPETDDEEWQEKWKQQIISALIQPIYFAETFYSAFATKFQFNQGTVIDGALENFGRAINDVILNGKASTTNGKVMAIVTAASQLAGWPVGNVKRFVDTAITNYGYLDPVFNYEYRKMWRNNGTSERMKLFYDEVHGKYNDDFDRAMRESKLLPVLLNDMAREGDSAQGIQSSYRARERKRLEDAGLLPKIERKR